MIQHRMIGKRVDCRCYGYKWTQFAPFETIELRNRTPKGNRPKRAHFFLNRQKKIQEQNTFLFRGDSFIFQL